MSTASDSDSPVDNSVLLASLLNLSVPHYLTPILTTATAKTRQKLVIVLYSRLFADPDTADQDRSHTGLWDAVQRLLTFVYVHTSKVAQDLDNPLLQIDVLLKGIEDTLPDSLGHNVGILFRIHGGT
jgi:pantetheine-phosphate adenylyltransferase